MRVKSNHKAQVFLSRLTGEPEPGQTACLPLVEEIELKPGQVAEVDEAYRTTSGVLALVADGLLEILDEAPAAAPAPYQVQGPDQGPDQGPAPDAEPAADPAPDAAPADPEPAAEPAADPDAPATVKKRRGAQ